MAGRCPALLRLFGTVQLSTGAGGATRKNYREEDGGAHAETSLTRSLAFAAESRWREMPSEEDCASLFAAPGPPPSLL